MFMDRHLPDPQSEPAHRLLFAAVPPAAVMRAMAAHWRQMGIRARLDPVMLHMPIQPVARAGMVDDALVAYLSRPMRGFRFPAFDITLDRVANFGARGAGRRPLGFTTRGQDAAPNALARAIRRRFAGSDWPLPRAYVTPHLLAAHGTPLPCAARLLPPIHWHVDTLTLIDSEPGQRTARALAQWPLD